MSQVAKIAAVDVEVVALEIHDALFAFLVSLPPWGDLSADRQEWFRDRARRLIERATDPEAT